MTNTEKAQILDTLRRFEESAQARTVRVERRGHYVVACTSCGTVTDGFNLEDNAHWEAKRHNATDAHYVAESDRLADSL